MYQSSKPKSKNNVKAKNGNLSKALKKNLKKHKVKLNRMAKNVIDNDFNHMVPEKESSCSSGASFSDAEAPQLIDVKEHRPIKKIKPQASSCDEPIKKKRKIKKHKKLNVDASIREAKQNGLNDTSISSETDDEISLQGEKAFNFLISPIQTATFFKKYWEKSPVFVSRNKGNYFASIISSEKLDKIFRENSLHYTRNVNVTSYENGIRETHNPEGRVIPAVVWDFYANGCSVQVLNPHTYCQKLHTLIAALQEFFGNMVGANLYLTPAGNQGFAPHYDDIEAFVLQIEGTKHWKLYSPKEECDVLPRNSSKNLSRDEVGNLIQEVTLNAGDLLYFPRGIVHEACSDENSHSLHITVSVYQHTSYADLLEHIMPEALKLAVQHDKEFREGLPLQYLRNVGAVNVMKETNVREEIFNKVQKLITKLIDYAPVDHAADQMGRKFMHNAMPPCYTRSEKLRTSKYDGDRLVNGKVEIRTEISLDTKVRLLRYHCLRLAIENHAAKIYYCTENANVYHGEQEQVLELELEHCPIIEALQNNYPNYVEIDALYLEDDCAKMQVVSDLWERGLVVTEEPLTFCDD